MDTVPGAPELVLDAGGRALVVTIGRAEPSTLARDPPSFHSIDYWEDP